MINEFTHLHVHTEFSLLDGAIGLKKLVRQAQEQELKSLAITDHGNIFGAVKFFDLCKKANIKPILGMEAYLTEDAAIRSVDNKYYHLIILVQNEIGYKNLCKLISFSYQDGFYFKPRIDYAQLQKYSEGLIVTSACLGGHIAQLLKRDQHDLVDERINWFTDTFGKDRFYFEVQPEDQDEQITYNKQLYDLSTKYGIDLVATTDCHYLSLDDHEAHEIMITLQTGKKFDDPNRFTFGDCRAYMRSKEEMLQEFQHHKDAVYNTGKIAEMCDFDFERNKLHFPRFHIPQGKTDVEYFKDLCVQGLENLITNKRINPEKKEAYVERLNIEMDLIINMGFVGYFLIVSDFIRWARKNDIPVGPGRGSAAGALVAWCLEITNIDPLQYNLLFERFLNPERVSMPDIDIDFCIEGRETVINHIKDTYGHDKVCQIITFGTMMAKGVIKDVARVLDLSFEESNMITKLIPDQLKITLKDALEQEPRIQELIDANPKVKHIFDVAFKLEGLTRHASKHAAGVVITPDPIDDMLPIYIPPRTNELVSQYAMTELESIGFLKIDLLGLKNLTLIKKALELIQKNHGVDINIDHIPLDDQKAFELIQAGKTSGVFQLESSGIKDVLRKLKPEKFEDIIAVNALYRPGPLGSGMVDDFILRKHGKQRIEYLFDELEPILAETYGVIVYQEQVMKIASTIGGYSLGESDILRRAMGKKKVEVMAEQKKLFIQRAQERNFNAKKAEQLFDLMAYFAGYGFNKSHSAAYALIAYQTAYLKANYPAEFVASLLSLEAQHADKLAFYLKEAKDMHIEILPPDVNHSAIDFDVINNKILFGLQGIKNIGLTALKNIIDQREKKGAFKDTLDFCTRIDLRTSNKRVIENLIAAGAFDSFAGRRAQKYEELPYIIERAIEIKRQKETGQMQLFGGNAAHDDTPEHYVFTTGATWTDKERLEKEKEVLGFYISSHPLETYETLLQGLQIPSFAQLIEKHKNIPPGGKEPWVIGIGLMQQKKEIMTKKGDRMAFLQVEDLESNAEIVVFPKLFAKIATWLEEHTIFIIKGTLDTTSHELCKIKATEMVPIDLFFDEWKQIKSVTLGLPDSADETLLTSIKDLLPKGKSELFLTFREHDTHMKLATTKKVRLSYETMEQLQQQNITISILAS